MNDTNLADLIRTDVTGTGLVVADASQGIARNCSHYESVEVWRHKHRRYRVTITKGTKHLRYGKSTAGKVELWMPGLGWTEVLTLDENDAALTGLPDPDAVWTEDERGDHALREQVEDASHNLAQSAVAILD